MTEGHYSSHRIVGVFSSEAKAREYVALMKNDPEGDSGDFEFNEYPIDTQLAEEWRSVYSCQIDADGNVINTREDRALVEVGFFENPSHQSSSRFYARSSISPEHAMKLCAEQRQDWLRRNNGPLFHWYASASGNAEPTITKCWHDSTDVPASYADNHGEDERATYYVRSVISEADALAQLAELRKFCSTAFELSDILSH